MDIGKKIKRLRQTYGLTQQELADRAELSKGFISQLERNLTSPSIITLIDILECLGTTPGEFFAERGDERIVFAESDMFEKTEEGQKIVWLVPNAQKNAIEPILLTLEPGASSFADHPHEGEEFGYVLSGSGILRFGDESHKIRKGMSFCYRPTSTHGITNTGKRELKVLWTSTPPSF